MATKKSKTSPAPAPSPDSFIDSAWDNLWGLTDDARIEIHKQVHAVISLADGALQGATGFASKQNDRVNELSRDGITSANQAGRSLVLATREAARKLRASYQSGTTQLVAGARDNVRSVADRASATARVMIAPGEDKKAA